MDTPGIGDDVITPRPTNCLRYSSRAILICTVSPPMNGCDASGFPYHASRRCRGHPAECAFHVAIPISTLATMMIYNVKRERSDDDRNASTYSRRSSMGERIGGEDGFMSIFPLPLCTCRSCETS
jgi:hypothetical protein